MSELLIGTKAVVFDLGNVIIDLHYERSVDALREISGISANDLAEMLVTSPVLKDFEVGKISEQEFRERFCQFRRLLLWASKCFTTVG